MTATTPSAGPRRPNVLWIQCDELRADALSCYGTGDPRIRTPHIDALADSGVLFERSYTASPICVPARTAQLLGLSPTVTGVYGNEAFAPGCPPATLPVTFPEILADAGYRTVSRGKEHVPRILDPWQSHDAAGSDMLALVVDADRADARVIRTPTIGHVVGAEIPAGAEFSADQVTDNTLAVLAELTGPDAPPDPATPWLLRASYLQPHTPVVVPEPWASRWADVAFDDPVTASEVSNFERAFGEVNDGAAMPQEDLRAARRLYHGSVAWVDDQVGRLLGELDARGLREDTVIVFTADHGAHLGEDGSFGKHTFAPQSHRVPLIIAWPGRLPVGQRRADLATSEDLAATLLGLVGVDVPDHMTGRDLFGDPAPDHLVSVIGYGAPASRAFPNLDAGTVDGHGWPQRLCIRTTRYRLDLTTRVDGRAPRPDEQDVALIDTLHDPHETTNVADDPRYADVRRRLSAVAAAQVERLAEVDDDAVYGSFVPPAPGRFILPRASSGGVR